VVNDIASKVAFYDAARTTAASLPNVFVAKSCRIGKIETDL
jgi:hypothetical protein